MLNLSKIDKSLIFTNRNGDKCIWISVVPNKDGADQYGYTHAVTLYNKDTRSTLYLGNLKPEEFGPKAPASTEAPASTDDDDLPIF